MSREKTIPTAALVLGAAGIIPFMACTVGLAAGLTLPVVGGGARLTQALIVYGVAILSFLGGVRWGIALGYEDDSQARRDYAIAVVPALVGWGAALLAPTLALWTLCAAFILLGLMDYGLYCREVAPEWYGRLRLGLSGAVAELLGVAAASA
ncbi:DUF3429 domain-containing protein [Bosea vaviloviae]|uniref:DUF3429 domain-containing protein n=1 Tax=Bosea vaviloviae TaxID=1526658 RepID=A0A0N0MBR9_9HYPH|nr:DUF3429 domain-containing protein [Bosea vaviloviae]KPH81270.1 hypothetical protein AE618_09625 [Bosea vaviloviae]